MSRTHQDVQLHVQPVKSVMVTSVSTFLIVHVSTRASLTKTVKSGRKIRVVQAASAAAVMLNAHQPPAMSLHANQVTTSILLMAIVVQHASEAIANVLIRQLVTNT
jgi:hydrogenase maturation factor